MPGYADLLPYCETDRQRQFIKALAEKGSIRKAAAHLGVDQRNLEKGLSRVKLQAANRGFAPAFDLKHPVPPTHVLKGASTYYDADGKVRAQWVKSERQHEDLIAGLRAAVDALKDDLPTYVPAKPAKAARNADLLAQYTITDYHLGMLAWGEETGADWDTDIAEGLILRWFEAAIASAPDSEQCVFAQLGDFIHFDGFEALTPANKHLLDVDTRFQKVVRTAIRVIRQIIEMLCRKHRKVHVIMADANHDPAGGIWLREFLAHVYQNDKRVTVDNSADTYYKVEFGRTLLMYHHGHKKGPRDIDTVLARKFRAEFGNAKHVYAHLGHLHHDVVLETNLMRVEQHRTLAAQDAYASRAGFMSNRDAKVIVYHKEHGEVFRLTLNPDMVWK